MCVKLKIKFKLQNIFYELQKIYYKNRYKININFINFTLYFFSQYLHPLFGQKIYIQNI